MNTVTILLSSEIYSRADESAKAQKIDVPLLCTAILTDHFLTTDYRPTLAISQNKPIVEERIFSPPSTGSTGHFDVGRAFAHFPSGSIKFAQAVVDEALSIPHAPPISCEIMGYGIKFHPNFVWIERVHQQGGRCAITLSLYGEPNDFKAPPPFLRHQRNSYSRALIESSDELNAALPLIREAYDLRFKRYK